ncbi:hypothetical protein PR048_018276 [Dryococelus australis]|uniref:Uncharacterized protein n=1 Tax=Dryococelus australis TaxID=614101 RepID=A0ABQ9HBT9_9NEOP|nr:hypothetical protein PR048_018276 [Dryococelus australis]
MMTLTEDITLALQVEQEATNSNKDNVMFDDDTLLYKTNKNLRTKVTIYQTTIQSAMLHGCEVWGHVAHTYIKAIQTTQNKILRVAMGATRLTPTDELHDRAKTKTITTIIKDRNVTFYQQTSDHMNPAIQKGTYDIDNTQKAKRPQLK